MAQWIKYLLSKHVDQSLDSHNLGKTFTVILAAFNPRTLKVEKRRSLDQAGSQNQ